MKQSIEASSKSRESEYHTAYNGRDKNACSPLDSMHQYSYAIISDLFQLARMFVKTNCSRQAQIGIALNEGSKRIPLL